MGGLIPGRRSPRFRGLAAALLLGLAAGGCGAASRPGGPFRLVDDAGLRGSLGEAAHRRTKTVFTIDRMIDSLLALYRELGARKQGGRAA